MNFIFPANNISIELIDYFCYLADVSLWYKYYGLTLKPFKDKYSVTGERC